MQKVPLKNKVLFGIGDMYAGGAFLIVGLLYLKFLTDVVGLAPSLAGTVFLIGKIWDAVSDPMMGVISDHTKSKFGRRRIYFLCGIIPVFVTFSMLWMRISNSSQISMFLYYSFSYILFNTGFTMVQVPYNAVLADMTNSYKERSIMSGIRLTFSAISAVIAGTIPMLLINLKGYTFMGLCFGIFYAIPWICVFLGTYENKEHYENVENETIKQVFKNLPTIFTNRSFRHHAGLFISSQSAVDFLTTLFIYYLTYVLKRENEFSLVMGAMLIVPIFMVPSYTKIANKYNKTTPMHIGLVVWIIVLFIALFLREGQPSFLIYTVAVFSGVGSASALFVPWSILPDITDVDELISAKRREGLYSGMATLLRKIAQAAAIFLVGVILDLVNYVPNVEQTPLAIFGIRLMFSIIPIILLSIALFFSYKYNLTKENHAIIIEEIDRRKNHKDEIASENTIKVCELVSGKKFEDLKL
ncbi:MAG: MFS transporter [Pleomorphochaeta sp.]